MRCASTTLRPGRLATSVSSAPVPIRRFCSIQPAAAAPSQQLAPLQLQLQAAAPAAGWGSSRPAAGPLRRRSMRTQAAGGPGGASADGKTRVLFVCLGNICRSPTAEAMFRAVVQRAGVDGQFEIDSCGTGGGAPNWYKPGGYSYHEGDESDPRMSAAAIKRGVRLTSRSRPLAPPDLSTYDYIIGMDAKNKRDILVAANYWMEASAGARNGAAPAPLPSLDEVRAKTSLMTEYCREFKGAMEVPDPYYGGPAGFEKVLDLLDDACTGLLEHIQEQQGR